MTKELIPVETYEDYCDFVTGLASHYTMTDDFSKLATFGLGLAGECGEIADLCMNARSMNAKNVPDDIVQKFTKELGDILWYAAFGARNVLNIKLQTVLPVQYSCVWSFQDILWRQPKLTTECCAIADMTKKIMYHGVKFDFDLRAKMVIRLKEVLEDVMLMASYVNYTLDQIRDINVTKLRDRYKDGKFSTAASIKKADDK